MDHVRVMGFFFERSRSLLLAKENYIIDSNISVSTSLSLFLLAKENHIYIIAKENLTLFFPPRSIVIVIYITFFTLSINHRNSHSFFHQRSINHHKIKFIFPHYELTL